MSYLEENTNSNSANRDRLNFSFSNRKMSNGENITNSEGKSSSKKKGKSNKIMNEKKSILNEKAQIKTPQSQTSKIKKGVAVNFLNIRVIDLFRLEQMKTIFQVSNIYYYKKKKQMRRYKKIMNKHQQIQISSTIIKT
jgi:hypothetical protein